MRLTKIYTKIGDNGTTMLADGGRLSKSDHRIEAYGSIDELNATIGFLRDQLHLALPKEQNLRTALQLIQNELFDIGAELSLPNYQAMGIKLNVVGESQISRLESEIDLMNEQLPQLANFILPGGHPAISAAHMSRTVCRRSERRVVSLHDREPIRLEILHYLNRLSDWLFVSGREIGRLLEVPEYLWQQRKDR